MRTLVFVAQLLDTDDPVLGFLPTYLEPLSERVDALVVVANEVGRVPQGIDMEVISLGKERGLGRYARTARYERALARLARRPGRVAVMAHMCPIYLVLAAGVARTAGVRTLLWFAAPYKRPVLRLADLLADVVLSTSRGSYPLQSAKLRCTGQAVDLGVFPLCDPPTGVDGAFSLLALGRTTPDKNFRSLIDATLLARGKGVDVALRIVGPSVTDGERKHRHELEALIGGLGAREREAVTLEEGVDHRVVPGLIRHAGALVNATVDGSADKTVFEAAASGRPVIASSRSFDSLLGRLPLELRFRPGDTKALADRIVSLTQATSGELVSLGAELRRRVERDHSYDHWADEVVMAAFGR